MASAHSQDEARARDFEGDLPLKKKDPKWMVLRAAP